jgi:hypothetical protein
MKICHLELGKKLLGKNSLMSEFIAPEIREVMSRADARSDEPCRQVREVMSHAGKSASYGRGLPRRSPYMTK